MVVGDQPGVPVDSELEIAVEEVVVGLVEQRALEVQQFGLAV